MHPSVNGTGFAVTIGLLLAFFAAGSGIPGLALARTIGDKPITWREVGRALSAFVLLVVAIPSAYGAGWLFWTAHRGDYAPWANARAVCRTGAADLRLQGSDVSNYVSQCVQKAIDYDAE